MFIDEWIHYGSMTVSILLLFIKRKGMKKYLPVGLFAGLYANIWCHIGMIINWWSYSSKITEIPVNCIVVPIMAMFWVRYSPLRLKKQILWAFLWTSIITGFEFIIERFTDILEYHNGYDWFYSYVLWFISWFIWYAFHLWFNNGIKMRKVLF